MRGTRDGAVANKQSFGETWEQKSVYKMGILKKGKNVNIFKETNPKILIAQCNLSTDFINMVTN